MGEEAPDKVLHRICSNLEKLKSCGDGFAADIQTRLRIIVSWVKNGIMIILFILVLSYFCFLLIADIYIFFSDLLYCKLGVYYYILVINCFYR